MSPRSLRAGLVALVATAGLAAGTASVSAAPGPPSDSFTLSAVYGATHPDADPAGANDPTCRPSAAHPDPVVLVHGTFANRYNGFASLSPRLKALGYCVYALNYGRDTSSIVGLGPSVYGMGDIPASAQQLASFVAQVRAQTGAAKVDLVGHSQGGVVARQFVKFDGGASVVRRVVTIGGTNHGTTLSGLTLLTGPLGLTQYGSIVLGTAAIQQVDGSPFLQALNAGGDTAPGIAYTAIATRYDEVSTPYQKTFLTAGPGATVQNVTLQDGCPIDLSDHLSMVFGPRIAGFVANALDPAHATTPPCVPKAPVL